jgi:hypothetical protein
VKMKRRRVLLLGALIIIPLGILMVVVFAPVVGVARSFKTVVDRAHRGRDRLFFETDYEELLAACRDLLRRTAAGELEGKQYFVHLGNRDPETLSFPRVILDLEPSFIIIDTVNHGLVWIALMPGPDSFGVVAALEGWEGKGEVRLVDGLWYFDGDYSEESPEYREGINAKIEEGRRLRAARASATTPVPKQGR